VNHSDWESQRERLSEYLDGELTPEERAAFDAHLRECEQCQRELAALRQTRALLRALPTPALPRDFSLPAQPVVVARRRAAPAWARPAQAIGTIAAMIGLAFLIATSLPSLPHTTAGGAATSGSSHTVNGPAAPSTHGSADVAATATPNSTALSGVQSTHSVTPAPSPTNSTYSSDKTPTNATAGATAGATTSGVFGPAQGGASGARSGPVATPAQPFPVAPVAGVTLLLGGAAALAVGSLARRRSREDAPGEPDDDPDSW
jgi:anti-sigma factor RsiW